MITASTKVFAIILALAFGASAATLLQSKSVLAMLGACVEYVCD